MLSSFPCLTENEFRDGCRALQKRCDGRLCDTDWLDIRWQQGALAIRKAYPVKTSERQDDVTDTRRLGDTAASLEEADEEDEVRHLPVYCTGR